MKLARTFGLVLGLGLAVVAGGACGDDNPSVNDGNNGSDSGIDGPPGGDTLTTFVIDLVKNHNDDATPATFGDFQNLPDPDGDNNNVHAYDSLF